MSEVLVNIEFYSTSEGDVMMKQAAKPARLLQENDREMVSDLLALIRDRYPKAHDALMKLYSSSSRNRRYYEFRMVSRFIRCNCGNYDQQTLDIDSYGRFRFEEVKCPLRGECQLEGVVCKPQLDTSLSDREMEVFRLIVDNMQADEIAAELNLSPCTINRHRENIKAKLKLRSVAELVNYWHENNLK